MQCRPAPARRGRAARAARAVLAGLIVTAAGLVASGCTAAPPVDIADALRWVQQQGGRDVPGVIATASLLVVPASAHGDDPAAGVTMNLPRITRVDGLRVACYGGGTILFVYETHGPEARSQQVSVRCDLAPHTVSVGDAPTDAVRVDATGETTYLFVEVIGDDGASGTDDDPEADGDAGSTDGDDGDADAAGPDPWQGYYDAQLRDGQGAMMQFGGSFGPPGQITVAQSDDVSLEPGHHIVQVECQGASTLLVTLAAITDEGGGPSPIEPVETTGIECPVSATLELTTQTRGIQITLDSQGAPGAFLVRVDPGTVTP